MSSIRNMIPRRKYKERGQLKRREKLGFLEKKKDYKERAKNYHEKEKMMNKLREKAKLKNPDEYYFKMNNAKIIDGEHVQLGKRKTSEKKKIDQTKNISLVSMRRMIEKGAKERLQENLHLIDFPKVNNHIYFVENLEELNKKADLPELPPTNPDFMSYKVGNERMDLEKLDNDKKQIYSKLSQSMGKEEKYNKIVNTLEMQKKLTGKGKKRKLVDSEGHVSYKWFAQRKT